MTTSSVVRARIDATVKREASDVLAKMGLSVSDAIRLLLVRVAAEKGLPIELKIPNEETIAAMEELERGEGRRSYDTVEEMMADLNAED